MAESQNDSHSLRRVLFFVALGAALYGVYCLAQLPGVLGDMSRVPRMTCDDLVRNGPAGHRYITLTDARLSDKKSVSERDSESGGLELYHPVYPAGSEREPDPRDLKLILCIMDEGERRRVRDDRNRRAEDGRPGLGEFTCEVRKGDRLPDWARDGLAATYPGILPDDCWMLVVGDKEPTAAFARHLAWHGGISSVASFVLFAWLWFRRKADSPQTYSASPAWLPRVRRLLPPQRGPPVICHHLLGVVRQDGRVVVREVPSHADEELLAYVGHVWPECCGTTMALFTETSPTDLWRLTPPPTD